MSLKNPFQLKLCESEKDLRVFLSQFTFHSSSLLLWKCHRGGLNIFFTEKSKPSYHPPIIYALKNYRQRRLKKGETRREIVWREICNTVVIKTLEWNDGDEHHIMCVPRASILKFRMRNDSGLRKVCEMKNIHFILHEIIKSFFRPIRDVRLYLFVLLFCSFMLSCYAMDLLTRKCNKRNDFPLKLFTQKWFDEEQEIFHRNRQRLHLNVACAIWKLWSRTRMKSVR